MNGSITDEFNKNKYVILEVFPKELCAELVQYFFELKEKGNLVKDEQCPNSYSIYGDSNFDKLLVDCTDYFSEASGLSLLPTYSYARIYQSGETLEVHKDRPACEISATILLGYDGENWEIFFADDGQDRDLADGILLSPGTGALYKGAEIKHWRNEFKGKWLCQVFLHYVNADGPYKDEKFDGRPDLGLPASSKSKKQYLLANKMDPIYFWQFDNVLSNDYCNNVIGQYGFKQMNSGLIGDVEDVQFSLNKKIRNVEKMLIPIHEGIGAHLIGSAFIANQQAWKFDITECQQIEYLRYGIEGRYKPHLDTFITYPCQQSRKLTALAFLNDDFEGGKFYLQIQEEKIYPLQTKGTIIVFPSFMLHGVEDVTNGVRHAVVCWLLGPSFR
jgi:hypothetical protein